MDNTDPIKVSISQFYGIEINDFAVTVAKTALWIAESQMMKETESIVRMDMDFLPLKTNANVVEGNALRIDWNEVVPKSELTYIMGNPPFVGYAFRSQEQKKDIALVCQGAGKNMDYVAGWYWKASELMQGSTIRAALVSTNSITQGEQVASIWKLLYDKFGIHIDFAHRTFRWDSEANLKAHVHCVIVGFSTALNNQERKLYENGRCQIVKQINPYLVDAETVFIEGREKPICNVPIMRRGSQPTDDGNLIMSLEEYEQYSKEEPQGTKFLRPYMMGKDFIDRKPRYCFWLVGANPTELRKCPQIMARVEKVREFRLASKKEATKKKAETPTLFDEIKACDTSYVAIPKVSSEKRLYVPMEYLDPSIIAGDKLFMVPDADLYTFGVLTSNIHMAWMRSVCGRLEMRYSYSNTIVYNNFPWPDPTDEQKVEIEKTAQKILDARAKYSDSSLADLYDPDVMPPELRSAHQHNDKAVMAAYGLKKNAPEFSSESACVAFLMKLYQQITASK